MSPPCLIRAKILTYTNEQSCRVCTTPGLTSFSNGENDIVQNALLQSSKSTSLLQMSVKSVSCNLRLRIVQILTLLVFEILGRAKKES